ncbi:hypothetical protein KJ784_00300 [Patescibacteria group bacterium]|nr:hypothetical protein [Patescibacteria group bacterium]
MKAIRMIIRVVGGLILMFSGVYFILGGTVSRAGVEMSHSPIALAISSLNGTLEFWLGIFLAASTASLFERRNCDESA